MQVLPDYRMESEELESSDSDGEISDDEGDSASPSSERSDQRDIIKSECNDTTGAGPSTVVDCVSERTAVEIESCVSERTAVEIESCVSERTVETDNMLLVRENDDEVGILCVLVVCIDGQYSILYSCKHTAIGFSQVFF